MKRKPFSNEQQRFEPSLRLNLATLKPPVSARTSIAIGCSFDYPSLKHLIQRSSPCPL